MASGPTGISGFGRCSVKGRRRVPRPAARTNACLIVNEGRRHAGFSRNPWAAPAVGDVRTESRRVCAAGHPPRGKRRQSHPGAKNATPSVSVVPPVAAASPPTISQRKKQFVDVLAASADVRGRSAVVNSRATATALARKPASSKISRDHVFRRVSRRYPPSRRGASRGRRIVPAHEQYPVVGIEHRLRARRFLVSRSRFRAKKLPLERPSTSASFPPFSAAISAAMRRIAPYRSMSKGSLRIRQASLREGLQDAVTNRAG